MEDLNKSVSDTEVFAISKELMKVILAFSIQHRLSLLDTIHFVEAVFDVMSMTKSVEKPPIEGSKTH